MSPLVTRPGAQLLRPWNAANEKARRTPRLTSSELEFFRARHPIRRLSYAQRAQKSKSLHALDPNGVCVECTRREGGTP